MIGIGYRHAAHSRHRRQNLNLAANAPFRFPTTEDPVADRSTLALFTALGERERAHGWNPSFSAEGRTEARGAVFVPTAPDHTTTWVIADQDEHGVRYARVTPTVTAGTIAVIMVDADAPACGSHTT